MASSPYGPAPASGRATLALALGIIGVVGGLGSCCCCLFTLLALCAPAAWFLGRQELHAIRRGLSPAAGEGAARTGMICGMVGSALLALYFVLVAAYVAVVGAGVALETLKSGGVLAR